MSPAERAVVGASAKAVRERLDAAAARIPGPPHASARVSAEIDPEQEAEPEGEPSGA